MLIDIALVLASLAALFFGGEWLVRGAIALAMRIGLSPLVISLTVVGFGTSTPELLVSMRAAIAGQSDIALGNVVGSNTANILLIIGLSALIAPMRNWDATVKRDAYVMLAVAVITLGLVQLSVIGRLAGLIMLGALAAYLATAYLVGRRTHSDAASAHDASLAPAGPSIPALPGIATAGLLTVGLALLFVGAEMLVRGATGLARDAGISEAVIGLTIVAVGTSLPELATSLVAAFRRHSDVAIGNVVGSNIFNILGILGITAIVTPVGVGANFAQFDVPVMLVATLVFAGLLLFGKSIGRVTALALLGAYAVYTVTLFVT
jgi:cation:H+ antiporter